MNLKSAVIGSRNPRACMMLHLRYAQYERMRLLFKKCGYDMGRSRHQVLKRVGKIKEPILDVGTGPGRMAYTIAKAGYDVTTIDISPEMLEVAKIYAEKFNVIDKIDFLEMDAHKLKFKDNYFGIVISANLLHDVNSPEQVISEIIRVCAHGGKITISDLNEKGRDLINKLYRLNNKVHSGKVIELGKVVGEYLKRKGIFFTKFDDGYVSTYIGVKK